MPNPHNILLGQLQEWLMKKIYSSTEPSPNMQYRDLSLERSKFAWDSANQAKRELGVSYKEYVTLVKNIPTSLYNNGLGQTLAFLNSKANSQATNPIFNLIQEGKVDQYRRAMRETMEFVTWLKLHSSGLNIETQPDVVKSDSMPETASEAETIKSDLEMSEKSVKEDIE